MDTGEGQEALFTYTTEGILVVNNRGEIVKINPAAERMFGYEKGELLGKQIETLIPEKYMQRHIQHRAGYMEAPHSRAMGRGLELYGARKDSSEFPVEVSLSPFVNYGMQFVIAFIVDITQRKIAEDKLRNYSTELEKQVQSRTMVLREAIAELEKTKEELKEALKKEKELNDLKSRFVSMASHEFRTPLSTILSSLSLVSHYGEANDREKQMKHINRIKSSVGSLTDILDDMLSVSKLEEGKVSASFGVFNLREQMEEVSAEMQRIARRGQKIRFIYEGCEEVNLDRKIIRHILTNLLSNAIKFSPEGEDIRLGGHVSDTEITLTVEDHGMGISEEDQAHLFERFFRSHHVANIQGTGLGLHIVAKYVELLEGRITCHSRLKEGTTFIIHIPNTPKK